MFARRVVASLVLCAVEALQAAGCGGGTAPDAGAQTDAVVDVRVDSGGMIGSDAAGDAVDCTAVCDRIAAICAGMSTIDDNWLSICRSNCEVRVAVTPDTARAEEACVYGAGDCTTAVMCAVDPLGG